MPLYEYMCKECDHTFEETKSIEDRNTPCDKPCPGCQKEGTLYIALGGKVGDPFIHLSDTKNYGESFTQMMKAISKEHPGSKSLKRFN